MKCISLYFLSAAAVFAQAGGNNSNNFTTGQAARLVIGQTTFTSQSPNSSDIILGGVGGIAYGADTLVVADANRVGAGPTNHRVLIYQNLSSMLPGLTDELTYSQKCPVCVGRATTVLGQPDFTTTTETIPATRSSLRLPTAVATDGVRVIVADTNHNRVLIWNRIPTTNNQPADVVVGQADFTSATVPSNNTPTAKSMRGPQGVWIQNGKLYVADTQNNRVLIFNQIPTSNGASADLVLGAPNLTTFVQPDLTQQTTSASAKNMLNPVAVTSDGTHLFVTDLGYNRVLVWNSLPTANEQPADVVIGQPDFSSSFANYGFKLDDTNKFEVPVLCTASNGTDANGNAIYPTACNATLNFPRFALAGGGRLFIADGGNDRVLVFDQIPTSNGAAATSVIGQIKGEVNQASDAADSLRTPMSLAWDGTNLYVSDAYNRRITVYTLAPTILPYQAVRNAASLSITATGRVTIGGTITAKDVVTIVIASVSYSYTVKEGDTIESVIRGLVDAINGSNSGQGDPNVLATADLIANKAVVLTARQAGAAGNDIGLSASASTNATVSAGASGGALTGGGDAAQIAPGTIVTILAGENTVIADQTAAADLTQPSLPTKLAGTSVYFNGIPAPIFRVSPTAVTAQVPWEVNDTTSINAYVRSVMTDGSILTTTPVAVTIVPANPGVFAQPGTDPAVGLILHGSSNATGIVDVQGGITANDVATVTIEDRTYKYTVVAGDTTETIRNALAALINEDPKVSAEPSGEYTRIVLRARVEGPEGNGIPYAASASSGAALVITAFSSALCCANVAGAPVTVDNPAIPGEFITLTATGLGLPLLTDENASLITTGVQYPVGGPVTQPTRDSSVSSIVGGKTADVISATLLPGTVGTFLVVLHLNADIPTNQFTPLTIAQDLFVSRVVTLPVVNPASQ